MTSNLQKFNKQFYLLNFLQMLEKLAYWIVLLQLPVYIAQKDAAGGLNWGQDTKGIIFFFWALIQNLTPVFIGGYADRFGHKKTLFISFIFILAGYVLLGTQNTYTPFLIGAIVLGLGSGIFKPTLQGAISSTLNEKNSSLGWGIYFMLLNLAVFVAPPLSKYLKEISWNYVFWGSFFIFIINIIVLFFIKIEIKTSLSFLRMHESQLPQLREEIPAFAGMTNYKSNENNEIPAFAGMTNYKSNENNEIPAFAGMTNYKSNENNEIPAFAGMTNLGILKSIFKNLFTKKVGLFVIFLSGFAIIYMQFYETLPNFIIDWTDSTGLVKLFHLPGFLTMNTNRGVMISYEWMYNINTFLIILFIAWLAKKTGRFNKVSVISFGTSLTLIGLLLCGGTFYGPVMIFGIIIYTFGEMLTNPKINDYLGSIAPQNEKAMYLSYLNISFAIGLGGGSLLGGYLYKNFAEKATLASRHIAENHFVFSIKNMSDPFMELSNYLKLSPQKTTELLWNLYHPEVIWIPFVIIGFASVVGLIYYRKKL